MLRKSLFILILSAKTILAQDTLFNHKILLQIPLLPLIDLYSGSSTRFGIEYKLKKRHYLYNELGTYLPNFNGINNNKGITAKLEYKIYLRKEWIDDIESPRLSYTQSIYISSQLFYKYQSYTTWDTILITPNYRQDYTVYKSACAFTIKFGWLNLFRGGIAIDLFAGIGLRYVSITSTLSYDEDNHVQAIGDYSTNRILNSKGEYFTPNLDAGIRLGYRIK